MNLKAMVEQISNQLEISDNHEDHRILRVIEDQEPRIFSLEGDDFLLFPVNGEPEDEEQERLEGLFTSIREFSLEGHSTFLTIRTSSTMREVFKPFIAELLFKDLSDPIASLEEHLSEWRKLWSGKSGRLSAIQQRGLIGELVVLMELVKNGGSDAVEKWVGPLDKVHDFEGSGLHIEVKETMMQPPSVYISMIKQVAPFEGDKELHLIVVGLEKGDEISLRKAVSNSRKLLSDSAHSGRLEHVLRRAGYRDEHATYYSREYAITYVRSHRITENSPVLNPSVLGDIPSTVSNIRYNLEVHAMEMHDLDEESWSNLYSIL
jgi:hypothetical protein